METEAWLDEVLSDIDWDYEMPDLDESEWLTEEPDEE